MAMQPPPSRYKVVERGRRLEVIDTRTGRPASELLPAPSGGSRGRDLGTPPRDLSAPPARRQGAKAGAGVDSDAFVTRRWYDDKAPRKIRLNFVNRERLLGLRWRIAFAVAILVVLSFLFWPLAVLLVFALATAPKLRAQLRVASTRWLDGLDQG